MIWFLFSFLLFLVGFCGSVFGEAGEFWLWFLALGLVLDATLMLLGLLDHKKFIQQSSLAGKISHIVTFLLAGLAAITRLRAQISIFRLLLVLVLVVWAYSISEITKSWRRKK
jgi:hypothetical protein